jgi:general L-amino acid transport system permease protein
MPLCEGKPLLTQAPDDKRYSSAPPQAAGGFDVFYSPRFRSLATQIVVVALLVWGLYEIVLNTQANLKRLNQNFGFDFLGQAAGFDILTSLVSYSSTSSYGRAVLVGLLNTLLVSVLGIILTTLLGFVVGVMRLSKNAVVNGTATVFVEFLRNTPLLLQILMWYALVLKPLPGPKQALNLADSVFVSNRGVIMPMPIWGDGAWFGLVGLAVAVIAAWVISNRAKKQQALTGKRLPTGWITLALILGLPVLGLLFAGWPVTWDYPTLGGFNFRGGMTLVPELLALLIALVIYTAAFIAEIVRAGIQAVSHGQSEAAASLGLDRSTALRLVVIPQAMRVIVPPLTSQYLNLTKNSSLAVAIGFPDLVATGGTVLNQTGKAIEIVSIWMIVYLGLSLLASAFMNWYNSRIKLVER